MFDIEVCEYVVKMVTDYYDIMWRVTRESIEKNDLSHFSHPKILNAKSSFGLHKLDLVSSLWNVQETSSYPVLAGPPFLSCLAALLLLAMSNDLLIYIAFKYLVKPRIPTILSSCWIEHATPWRTRYPCWDRSRPSRPRATHLCKNIIRDVHTYTVLPHLVKLNVHVGQRVKGKISFQEPLPCLESFLRWLRLPLE